MRSWMIVGSFLFGTLLGTVPTLGNEADELWKAPAPWLDEVYYPWSEMSDSHVYFATRFGLGWASDQVNTGPNIRDSFEYDSGPTAGGALGYQFPRRANGRYRAEVELIYRTNEVETVFTNGVPQRPGEEVNSYAIMLNVLFDFDRYLYIENRWLQTEVTPYVGAGVGGVIVENSSRAGAAQYTGNNTVLGAQVMAGSSIRVANGVDLFIELRLMVTDDGKYTRIVGPQRLRIVSDYGAASILTGVRVNIR